MTAPQPRPADPGIRFPHETPPADGAAIEVMEADPQVSSTIKDVVRASKRR